MPVHAFWSYSEHESPLRYCYLRVDDVKYNSLEQYFRASMARFAKDEEALNDILSRLNPYEVKS